MQQQADSQKELAEFGVVIFADLLGQKLLCGRRVLDEWLSNSAAQPRLNTYQPLIVGLINQQYPTDFGQKAFER